MSRSVTAVAAGGLLILGACTGDGPVALTDAELSRISQDPRVVRLEGILERADTLLVPSLHLSYSLSAQGLTLSDSETLSVSCVGTSCLAEDGTELTVPDLLDPAEDIDLTEVSIGSQDGFDTVATRGRFEVSSGIPDGTFTSVPTPAASGSGASTALRPW